MKRWEEQPKIRSDPARKFVDGLTFRSSLNTGSGDRTNEAYTSQASFLDGDPVLEFREDKRGTHSFSGEPDQTEMYRNGKGYLINADLNGGYNMIRKSSGKSHLGGGMG